MRNSKRLTREAIEAMDAETNRDKAAVHAQIESDRELVDAIEAGRAEDLAAIDSMAHNQRVVINLRADMITESIKARIAANEGRLRDLEGAPDKKRKTLSVVGEQPATGTE